MSAYLDGHVNGVSVALLILAALLLAAAFLDRKD